ncbi:MAG: hypothetical protein QOF76_3301 [Solirubrobacteraceae bacterium]|jgi:hypothetical protein|nr:hypothetical protein [Solirubrobacteraceae bacterium]
MHTIAVHANLLSLAERDDTVSPGRWFHDLADGSLTYQFSGSPNTFTWQAPAIASMARTLDAESLTPKARELLERWEAVCTMLDQAERVDPDRVLVDHEADEMTLIWDDPKRVLVVGGAP